MKSYAIIAAAALFVAMTGSAFAECDTHKGDRDTDKQTKCSEKCEDTLTSRQMNYFAETGKLRDEATACFTQCGCAEYGEKFIKDHGAK